RPERGPPSGLLLLFLAEEAHNPGDDRRADDGRDDVRASAHPAPVTQDQIAQPGAYQPGQEGDPDPAGILLLGAVLLDDPTNDESDIPARKPAACRHQRRPP